MREIEALRRLPNEGGTAPEVDVVDKTLSAIRQQASGSGGVDPVFASCSVASCIVAAVAVPLGLSALWVYTDPFGSFLRPFTLVMQ